MFDHSVTTLLWIFTSKCASTFSVCVQLECGESAYPSESTTLGCWSRNIRISRKVRLFQWRAISSRAISSRVMSASWEGEIWVSAREPLSCAIPPHSLLGLAVDNHQSRRSHLSPRDAQNHFSSGLYSCACCDTASRYTSLFMARF